MAASRIRGITVEISGDTTKQQTALKSINSEIKNTQSQLKDIEKLRDKAREMGAKGRGPDHDYGIPSPAGIAVP